ncbi:MAG: hypothetical protein EOO54_03760 [Haliea sp.]|nr:MAG: hypothetical protein EOO54_03760 [Haliea sp.]
MSPHFKLTATPLLVLLLLVSCATAKAQGVAVGNELQQSATGRADNYNAPVFNMPAAPGVTAGTLDQRVHTNQAASAAPAFGVQGYGCALPGSGVSLQVAQVGISGAKAGQIDPGCAGPRDINTMGIPGFTEADRLRRACAVPDILAAAPDTCAKVMPRPVAGSSTDPYIAARLARQ